MPGHIRSMFLVQMITTLAGTATVALAEVIQPVAAGTVDCAGNVWTSLFRARSGHAGGCPAQGVLEFDLGGTGLVTSAVLGIRPDSIFNGTDPEDNFEDIVPLELIAFPGDGEVTSADYQGSSGVPVSQSFAVFSTAFPVFLPVAGEVNEAIKSEADFITFVIRVKTAQDPILNVHVEVYEGGVIEDNFSLSLDMDTDNDLIQDGCDNCPDIPNHDQADCQPNGIGDVCDIASGESSDDDGNGVPDECDPCVGDLNDDEIVSAEDLAIMLGAWGTCVGCPADILPDGVVDAGDLALLLGSWGPCF